MKLDRRELILRHRSYHRLESIRAQKYTCPRKTMNISLLHHSRQRRNNWTVAASGLEICEQANEDASVQCSASAVCGVSPLCSPKQTNRSTLFFQRNPIFDGYLLRNRTICFLQSTFDLGDSVEVSKSYRSHFPYPQCLPCRSRAELYIPRILMRYGFAVFVLQMHGNDS